MRTTLDELKAELGFADLRRNLAEREGRDTRYSDGEIAALKLAIKLAEDGYPPMCPTCGKPIADADKDAKPGDVVRCNNGGHLSRSPWGLR